MRKREFVEYLRTADFGAMFNDMGYDNPSVRKPLPLDIDGDEPLTFDFVEVAQKSSFKIYRAEVDRIPTNALCRKIDHRLRKYGENYIAIFTQGEHHLWIVPVKANEKRTLVGVEYENAEKAEFLAQKMDNLSFGPEEEVTIVDVTARVQKEFAVNSEKITKDFYTGFRKQHESFAKFISGIDVEGDRQWYVSVMLNRLMFCYFIQKKGFLNFDEHYLRNKLEWVKANKGANQYFTFYKGFLKALFLGGLNAPGKRRKAEFEKTYGKIPYLNGGMFDEHQIEKEYTDIDIADDAFESLFDFFDKWNWHLDTRISASGRDINPDVLGYIFEQYINDRAQMGAYYTKEDITEYIARNTIVPWVFNETEKKAPAAFKPDGFVWKTLKNSGDAYIFPAVLKGVDLPLPPEIEKGVSVEPQKTLRARRAGWNRPASPEYALPTEIWRETAARRKRCAELREKISSGSVKGINDFITLNLDIRRFAEDLIEKAPDESFVGGFYSALQNGTVLDPTCGSGAFLFAALNIMEPLYEACIERMEEFNRKTGAFKAELDEIKNKYRSNIQYFIYKSIILRNLYGVDIMHEAVEIAKLRLFLKMVAVVDVDKKADNLGLDPLPDIDFNIRCGNTLVGFANPQGVKDAILPPDELALDTEAYEKVNAKAAGVSDLYENFKSLQQTAEGTAEFYAAKKKLNEKLATLNDELDRAMARRQYNIDADSPRGKKPFEEWKAKAQPFHWYSEFYGITVANGGFDVIIGNPPYIELKEVRDYTVRGYSTIPCANLYAIVMERCKALVNERGRQGFIVPVSSVSTDRYASLQTILAKRDHWYSNYDDRPGRLFEQLEHIRLSIHLLGKESKTPCLLSTGYRKWGEGERNILFETVTYVTARKGQVEGSLPKLRSDVESGIVEKMACQQPLISHTSPNGRNRIHYTRKLGSFVQILDFIPEIVDGCGVQRNPSELKDIRFERKCDANVALCGLNASLFRWFLTVYSDCRNLNKREIEAFPLPFTALSDEPCVDRLATKLMKNLAETSEKRVMRFSHDVLTIQCIIPKLSKFIIDEIDELLAKYYGFTEEELDFIINYDIKYRMGDKLGEDEE